VKPSRVKWAWLWVAACVTGGVVNLMLVAENTGIHSRDGSHLWGFFACLAVVPLLATGATVLVAGWDEAWSPKTSSDFGESVADAAPVPAAEGELVTADDEEEEEAPRITEVSYRRLRTFGHYENESVGVTVSVPEGADPQGVLHVAQLWVGSELKVHEDVAELQQKVSDLRAEKRQVEFDLAEAKKTWEKAKAFLAKFGVGFDEPPPF
jgi:hypothetical protein